MLSYWGHALGMVSNHPNNFSPSLWWAIKPSWRAHHCDTAHVYSLHKDVGPKEIDKIESSSHPVNMWPKSIYLGPGLHKNYPGFQLFISDKPRTHVKKAVSGPFLLGLHRPCLENLEDADHGIPTCYHHVFHHVWGCLLLQSSKLWALSPVFVTKLGVGMKPDRNQRHHKTSCFSLAFGASKHVS